MGWYSIPEVIVHLKDGFTVSLEELKNSNDEDYVSFFLDLKDNMRDMSDIEKVLFMRMFRKDVVAKGGHWDLWCGHGNLKVKVNGNTAVFTSCLKRGMQRDLEKMVAMVKYALKGQYVAIEESIRGEDDYAECEMRQECYDDEEDLVHYEEDEQDENDEEQDLVHYVVTVVTNDEIDIASQCSLLFEGRSCFSVKRYPHLGCYIIRLRKNGGNLQHMRDFIQIVKTFPGCKDLEITGSLAM